MGKKEVDTDLCSICGDSYDAFFGCFSSKPFANGLCYPIVCFACGSVPYSYLVKAGEQEIALAGQYIDGIYSLVDMLAFGFKKDVAIKSITEVAKLLKIKPMKIKEYLILPKIIVPEVPKRRSKGN